MAEFNAELLRALGMGPEPSLCFLKAMEEKIRPDNEAIQAYLKFRDSWTAPQKELHDLSKELLYAAVMFRAAALLEHSGQNKIDQEERMTEASVCLRIISQSFNQPANKHGAKGETGHERSNPARTSFLAAGATDNKVLVTTFGIDEDKYASLALKMFSESGLACPPD